MIESDIERSIFSLLNWSEACFREKAIDSPKLTAEILLGHCLGITQADLYLQYDRILEDTDLCFFKQLVKRRIQREPVAYIIGEKGFYDSIFKVGPGVLIPRPDTEIMVEKAIEFIRTDDCRSSNNNSSKSIPKRVLELGVGSGAVLVSVALACPDNIFFGIDVSQTALAIASVNAADLVDTPIHFICSSWFSSLKAEKTFDLILSNPPYISTGEIYKLAPEIYFNEPLSALDGGFDGLDNIRTIIREFRDFLAPTGKLLIEIGYDQKSRVESIIKNSSQSLSFEFFNDLSGHNRLVCIQKAID